MEDKSSTVWSSFVQRPETLYETRAVRFCDENRQHVLGSLDFEDGMSILEVGCGPGAFCHALERWLPHARIAGLDRDSAFIDYAAEKSRELGSHCHFVVGDATNLEFPGSTFDATTSHTVAEHVETRRFLAEQYRVLRAGGVFTLLSVRTSLSVNPEPWKNGSSEEEKVLWDKVEPYFKASGQKHGVAKHSIGETEMAVQMMKTGFHDISIDFLAQTSVPDNAGIDHTLAKAMIEAGRQVALDAVALANAVAPAVLSNAELERLRWLINSRFDQRIRFLEAGQKVWDVSASVLMVARGYK